MAFKDVIMLGFIAICLLLNGVEGRRRILSREEDLELDRQLKILRKPAIKTIKTEYGQIFDCVGINKQPSLDHPLLKNHTVQLSPAVLPRMKSEAKSSSTGILVETELKDGGCPQGTVPIERVTKEDLIRHKFHQNAIEQGNSNHQTFLYAVGHSLKYKYYGSKGNINVWQPQVTGNQNSGAYIIVRDDLESDKHNSIRVGWMVSQVFYKDNLTHLHGHWTLDNFKKTGCSNVRCPGFVQVSPNIPLGIHVYPVSIYNGEQYEIIITLYREPVSKDWWLLLGDKVVGYYPKTLFNSYLVDHASTLHYGGYVFNPSAKDPAPPMGSGHFPDEGFKKAAYISHLHHAHDDGSFEQFYKGELYNDYNADNCYNAFKDADVPDGKQSHMFGGPGGNC